MSDLSTRSPPSIPWRTWKIAAVIGLGSFMVLLDTTVANLALESIRADYRSSLATVQWVITAYLIALAVSLPTSGWLGSRYGYGRIWAVALFLFVVASVLCALATGPLMLIGARLLQGLAGGLLVPAGQAVVGSTAKPNQLGRVVGTLGFAVALGPALGPALGGAVLEVASWRWLFWFNVPLGLLALLAARGLVPRGSRTRNRTFDWRGLALLSLGLPLLLYGAAELGASGAGTVSSLAMVAGLVLVASFIALSSRIEHPLVDLRLFRNRTFLVSTFTVALTGASMYGGLLLIPLYLQLAMGESAAATGLLLLFMGLGTAVALPLAGVLTDRVGAGIICLVGATTLLLSTLPFLFPAMLSLSLIAAVLIFRGLALAWAQMPAMTTAYGSATIEQMGDAATLLNIAQRIGGAMGAIGVVMLLDDKASSDAGSYFLAFAALVILAGLTVVSTGVLRGALRARKAAKTETVQ